jgi:BON domain-containing protein
VARLSPEFPVATEGKPLCRDEGGDAEDGVVYLRGEAETPEMIEVLVERTRKVPGVKEVESLLHLPNTPAPSKR